MFVYERYLFPITGAARCWSGDYDAAAAGLLTHQLTNERLDDLTNDRTDKLADSLVHSLDHSLVHSLVLRKAALRSPPFTASFTAGHRLIGRQCADEHARAAARGGNERGAAAEVHAGCERGVPGEGAVNEAVSGAVNGAVSGAVNEEYQARGL